MESYPYYEIVSGGTSSFTRNEWELKVLATAGLSVLLHVDKDTTNEVSKEEIARI